MRGFSLAFLALALLPFGGSAQTNEPIDLGLILAEQSRPSFTLIGAGARAAGMGGAFTALADDASAASFNPAGLALLIAPEISVVGASRSHEEDYTEFYSLHVEQGVVGSYDDTSTSFNAEDLNFAAFTLPFPVRDRNFCVQFSYHRQIDFTVDTERELAERNLAGEATAILRQTIHQGGDIHTFSLATAYQLSQRLSLGVSLSRWIGDWRFSSASRATREGASETAFYGYDQENALRGWNWSAGALLRYRYLNLGFVYRFPFDSDYTFSEQLTSSLTPGFTEPAVELPLHFPRSWTFGLAVKPTDTWHITADFARYYWSEMEVRKTPPDGESINFFDLEASSQTSTPNVGHLRLGTELTLFAGRTPVALRAGYLREEQPLHFFALPREDTVVRGVTLGVGAKVGPFAIDLAYQRTESNNTVLQLLDPRNLVDIEFVAIGSKHTREQRVFIGVLYQFPTEAMRRALHFLFVGPLSEDTAHDS